MSERFVLVVNPRAGSGAAGRLQPELEAAFRARGVELEVAVTDGPGGATRLVREALEGGAAGVAIVGGDGTSNEAINGYFTSEGEPVAPGAWLCPLPCGTGGDFRRTLGMAKGVEAMVTHLLEATPRHVDVGHLRCTGADGETVSRFFLNIASFGLSGRVVKLVDAGPKWIGGKPAFFLGTLRALRGHRNPRVKLTLDDGEPRVREVMTVAVANGRYFGGGMQIAPRAEIDDGLFDVVALEGFSARDVFRIVSVYRGTHLSIDGVRFDRARKVEAEALDGAEVLIDLDGEAPGRLPAVFTMRAGALLLRA